MNAITYVAEVRDEVPNSVQHWLAEQESEFPGEELHTPPLAIYAEWVVWDPDLPDRLDKTTLAELLEQALHELGWIGGDD